MTQKLLFLFVFATVLIRIQSPRKKTGGQGPKLKYESYVYEETEEPEKECSKVGCFSWLRKKKTSPPKPQSPHGLEQDISSMFENRPVTLEGSTIRSGFQSQPLNPEISSQTMYRQPTYAPGRAYVAKPKLLQSQSSVSETSSVYNGAFTDPESSYSGSESSQAILKSNTESLKSHLPEINYDLGIFRGPKPAINGPGAGAGGRYPQSGQRLSSEGSGTSFMSESNFGPESGGMFRYPSNPKLYRNVLSMPASSEKSSTSLISSAHSSVSVQPDMNPFLLGSDYPTSDINSVFYEDDRPGAIQYLHPSEVTRHRQINFQRQIPMGKSSKRDDVDRSNIVRGYYNPYYIY